MGRSTTRRRGRWLAAAILILPQTLFAAEDEKSLAQEDRIGPQLKGPLLGTDRDLDRAGDRLPENPILTRVLPAENETVNGGGELGPAEPPRREDTLKNLASWLGITCHIVDLRADFDSLVIQPFVAAYQAGLTPNPCSICNPGLNLDS